MAEQKNLPRLNRLSVISSLVLLAYATTTFISIPTQTLNLQLPGFLVSLKFNFITVVATIVAILMAAGTDWLISEHPQLKEKNRLHHWMVPAFTAIAVGIPLGSETVSPSWWVIFAVGGLLLAGVLVAEYIVVDPEDTRHAIATLGLNAVSFALFLLMVASLSASGERLYILFAAIVPATFLITTRTLYLRLGGKWRLVWAAVISLIMVQVAAGLFYLPIRPVEFSLILVAFLYGLIALAANLEEKQPTAMLWVEPALMTGVFLILGFLL